MSGGRSGDPTGGAAGGAAGGDFLSRWSRRKIAAREAEAEAESEAAAAPAAATDPLSEIAAEGEPGAPHPPAVSEEEAAQLSDEEILARLDLPHPDSVTDTDGARAFLRAGVPQRLKRLALRRMWAVTPESQLACFDGLRDYADDYTDAAMGAGSVTTTYEVGRGLRAHLDELARQAEAKARALLDAPAEAGAEAPAAGARDPAPEAPAPGSAARAADDRSHVRPPDPSVSLTIEEVVAESETVATAPFPDPDENASCRNVADAAMPQDDGAAQEARRPRRMVFRFHKD